MGRSVSTPSDCVAVAYQHHEFDEYDSQWEWDELKANIRERCIARWPSFEDTSEWLGNEDQAILENQHAKIGLSEYCGLVSIWLVVNSRSDTPELAEAWCNSISDNFYREFGELRRVGTFSNGESVYEQIPRS